MAIALASVAACWSPTGPKEPITYEEHRGQVIASGVRQLTNSLIDPQWVFLDNDQEIAYVAEGAGQDQLWVRSLGSANGTPILELDGEQHIAYAPGEDRIYVSHASNFGLGWGITSVAPDGSEQAKRTDDPASVFDVSPDGRYLFYNRADGGPSVMIDQELGERREVDSMPWLRLYDDYAAYVVGILDAGDLGLAIADLATGETNTMRGLAADFPHVIDVGGTRDAPRLTVVDGTDQARIMIFTGDAATGGGSTRQLLVIPAVSGQPSYNVTGGASPDGDWIALGVNHGVIGGCPDIPLCRSWDILLVDALSGSARAVADGRSNFWPHGVVLSPNGRRLLYEVDGSLYLVELG